VCWPQNRPKRPAWRAACTHVYVRVCVRVCVCMCACARASTRACVCAHAARSFACIRQEHVHTCVGVSLGVGALAWSLWHAQVCAGAAAAAAAAHSACVPPATCGAAHPLTPVWTGPTPQSRCGRHWMRASARARAAPWRPAKPAKAQAGAAPAAPPAAPQGVAGVGRTPSLAEAAARAARSAANKHAHHKGSAGRFQAAVLALCRDCCCE